MRRIILFFLIFLLFSVSVVSALEVKWSQPPQLNPSSPYPGCYWGWDELSIYEGPQIVGDDWLCNDQRPVVAIRWWGSYLGWDLMYAPPIVPDAFHLAIWTDVPAGGSEPFSHPDFLIWEVTLPYLDVNEVVAGCDYYPGHFMDTCFQYDVLLDPAQWFFQPPMPNVYWLTISAIYSVPPVANEWGWKTREHFFNDAAIRIFDPLIPTVGSVYVLGEPIEAPAGVAWDLAFELFTEDSVTATPTNTPVATNTPEPTDTPEPTATETPSELPTNTPTATIIPTITPFPDDMKWSQEPQLNPLSPYPDCFWGWDEVSIFSQYQIAADDWLCVDDRPVTGIRWWGSYLGWDLPISPPIVPDFFHLGIWTDVPASGTEPFSHPDWMIWETVVPYPLVMEIPVGCDYYPGYAYDTCFEYYYQIPEMEWFYQEPGPTVYWLSVSAMYSIPPGVNEWGWKTREHYFNDAAVRIFMPTAPGLGASYVAGEPIEEPVGTPWDLSFQILTTAIPTTIPTATPTYPPTATPTTGPTSTPYPIPSVDGRGMSLLIIILTLLIFVTGFRLHQ